MSAAPVPGFSSIAGRVSAIEARIGVRTARGTDARASLAFEQLMRTHASSSPSPGASTGPGRPPGTSPTAITGAMAELVTRLGLDPAGPTAATTSGGLAGVPYAALFEQAGRAHGVDPALLAAVADAESGYDPTAVSHAGAEGLMQLMPATARGLGVADSFDPTQAVDGAARLLAGHLDRFGSVDLALAAYNAGPGAVTRFGGIPPYAETQAYVPKVLNRYEELRP